MNTGQDRRDYVKPMTAAETIARTTCRFSRDRRYTMEVSLPLVFS